MKKKLKKIVVAIGIIALIVLIAALIVLYGKIEWVEIMDKDDIYDEHEECLEGILDGVVFTWKDEHGEEPNFEILSIEVETQIAPIDEINNGRIRILFRDNDTNKEYHTWHVWYNWYDNPIPDSYVKVYEFDREEDLFYASFIEYAKEYTISPGEVEKIKKDYYKHSYRNSVDFRYYANTYYLYSDEELAECQEYLDELVGN